MINYYRLEHEHDLAKNTIVINWCLLNVCNYRCSYCPEYLHSGTTGFPKLSEVEMLCTEIIEHYKNKNTYFEFTGGEVTFWKDFPKLVDFFLEKYAHLKKGKIGIEKEVLKIFLKYSWPGNISQR